MEVSSAEIVRLGFSFTRYFCVRVKFDFFLNCVGVDGLRGGYVWSTVLSLDFILLRYSHFLEFSKCVGESRFPRW